jgi:hypothetical protein
MSGQDIQGQVPVATFMEETLEETIQAIQRLTAENERLMAENTRLTVGIEKLGDSNNQLTRNLQENNQNFDIRQAGFRAQVDALHADLDLKSANVASLELELAQALGRAAHAGDSIFDMDFRLNAANQTLGHANTQIFNLRREILAQDNMISSLEQDLEESRDLTDEADARIFDLQLDVQAANEQAQYYNDQVMRIVQYSANERASIRHYHRSMQTQIQNINHVIEMANNKYVAMAHDAEQDAAHIRYLEEQIERKHRLVIDTYDVINAMTEQLLDRNVVHPSTIFNGIGPSEVIEDEQQDSNEDGGAPHLPGPLVQMLENSHMSPQYSPNIQEQYVSPEETNSTRESSYPSSTSHPQWVLESPRSSSMSPTEQSADRNSPQQLWPSSSAGFSASPNYQPPSESTVYPSSSGYSSPALSYTLSSPVSSSESTGTGDFSTPLQEATAQPGARSPEYHPSSSPIFSPWHTSLANASEPPNSPVYHPSSPVYDSGFEVQNEDAIDNISTNEFSLLPPTTIEYGREADHQGTSSPFTLRNVSTSQVSQEREFVDAHHTSPLHVRENDEFDTRVARYISIEVVAAHTIDIIVNGRNATDQRDENRAGRKRSFVEFSGINNSESSNETASKRLEMISSNPNDERSTWLE